MAWIGYAGNDKEKTICPMASAGVDSGYIAAAKFTCADVERNGPIGAAIHAGLPVIVQDVATDSTMLPLRTEALERGYKSVIAMPLVNSGRTFGVIGIYAQDIDAFTTDNVVILKELSDDIAFGIRSIRIAVEQKKDMVALKESYAKENALFESLCEAIVAVDNKGIIITVNQALGRLLGLSREKILGYSFQTIFSLADEKGVSVGQMERPLAKVLAGSQGYIAFSGYLNTANKNISVEVIAAPVMVDSMVIGAVDIIRDTTKQKELDKARLDFFSLASHQLRTPLTGIRWITEILKGGKNLSEKEREYMSDADTLSAHLLGVIDEMLNMATVEGGTYKIMPIKIDIIKFIHDYLKEVRPIVDKNKLQVIATDTPDTLEIESDMCAMRAVINTIVANAVEYNNIGGIVELHVTKPDESHVRIIVKDTGIGIPQGDLPHIFEKFKRAANAKKIKVDGTGIGLYIAKQFADLVGATITFESEEGKGSTFTAEFPLFLSQTK